MIVALLALQAAAPLPDIELHAQVRARSLTIEKKGEARLEVFADPPGRNLVDVRAPDANGRKTIRNPQMRVDVEARIAAPQPATGSGERR